LDDIEIFEEGIGDILLDENAMNTLARPGTSIMRPAT
jgi:tetratricopeptide repeat protein 8